MTSRLTRPRHGGLLAAALCALTLGLTAAGPVDTASANWTGPSSSCGMGCTAWYEYKCSWGSVWRRWVNWDRNVGRMYYGSWTNTRVSCR